MQRARLKSKLSGACGLCLTLAALTLSACRAQPGPAPLSVPEPELAEVGAQNIALWPDEAFRATQPQAGPPPALNIPTLAQFTLSNGLEVYFVREEQLPIARMWFEFDVGAVDDPKGKSGLHELCFDLLDEGTRDLDKAAFEAMLDDRALRLNSSAGLERANLSVSSLASEMPAALDAAKELLTRPGLRRNDFERLRERMSESLIQQKATHVAVARRLLPSLVYGEQHPYGRFETEASLAKIASRDCSRVAKKLGPNGARLFVAAKMSQQELTRLLEDKLGSWKGQAPKPRAAVSPSAPTGSLYFVDMPGSNQSTISVASLGPSRVADDYAATSIMTRILGGSFSSRLNMNLREDKGFAYGARGAFSYRRHASHLSAGARVRADATVQSVSEVLRELAGVREGPLEPSELSRERDGALAALPGAFGSATRTLGSFRSLAFWGLPFDWHAQHAKALEALDLDAVEGAGRQHLPTDAYVVLVVGDAAVVGEGLKALASERELKLVRLDVDGKLQP